jgi:hypothetical protein
VHEVDQGAFHVHHDPPMYNTYIDRHMEKVKRIMRHIKLISTDRRLFWIKLEVNKVDQRVLVHHDPHLPHVQGQAHGEVQEGHEAYQFDQNQVVLDALRSA